MDLGFGRRLPLTQNSSIQISEAEKEAVEPVESIRARLSGPVCRSEDRSKASSE